MFGVYAYVVKSTKKVIYIGSDSNIEIDSRHKAHLKKFNKNQQLINQFLQSKPKEWEYVILLLTDYVQVMHDTEKLLIALHQPEYNQVKYRRIQNDINSTKQQ